MPSHVKQKKKIGKKREKGEKQTYEKHLEAKILMAIGVTIKDQVVLGYFFILNQIN